VICVIDQRRQAERGQVCQPCRAGLARTLRELGEAYAALGTPEVPEPGADPVSAVLPAGHTRAAAGAAPVSGSREAPVPVSVDLVDLTAHARAGAVRDARHDQIGGLSVASVLDQWVRDWRSHPTCPGEHLPAATVPALLRWLADRADWAADVHPAVDEWVGEMRALLQRCRRAAGDIPDRPELLDGVPCSCDVVGALYRDHASRWTAECAACGRLWDDDEYQRWVKMLAAGVEAA
jgi:hypothetical protein